MEIKIEEGSQQDSKELKLASRLSLHGCLSKEELKQELHASADVPKAAKKLYQCSLSTCNKCFTHRSTLIKHQRIHKGERPYPCQVCGQAFVQSSNLKRHMLVHTGEKPFVCDVCDKTFTTASNLKIHKETHKSEQSREKFKCLHCYKVFLYRSSLIKHENKCAPTEKKDTNSAEEVTHEITKHVKKEEEAGNLETSSPSGSDLESPEQLKKDSERVNLQQTKSSIISQETGKNGVSLEDVLNRLLTQTDPMNSLNVTSPIRLGLPSINSQLFDQNLLMRSLALNVELLMALKPNNCNPSLIQHNYHQ